MHHESNSEEMEFVVKPEDSESVSVKDLIGQTHSN